MGSVEPGGPSGSRRSGGAESGVEAIQSRGNIASREDALLEFGKRYKVIKEGVFASQFDQSRTILVSTQDPQIPVGTVFSVLDWLEWDPFSSTLKKNSHNPNFYDISLEQPIAGFASQALIVQPHVLEQSAEPVKDP